MSIKTERIKRNIKKQGPITTIIFLCLIIALFSLFLNKKIMVIIWLIAFSQAEGVSLRIDEFCEIYAEEYCADNNCDKKVFFTKKCQNDFVLE